MLMTNWTPLQLPWQHPSSKTSRILSSACCNIKHVCQSNNKNKKLKWLLKIKCYNVLIWLLKNNLLLFCFLLSTYSVQHSSSHFHGEYLFSFFKKSNFKSQQRAGDLQPQKTPPSPFLSIGISSSPKFMLFYHNRINKKDALKNPKELNIPTVDPS